MAGAGWTAAGEWRAQQGAPGVSTPMPGLLGAREAALPSEVPRTGALVPRALLQAFLYPLPGAPARVGQLPLNLSGLVPSME